MTAHEYTVLCPFGGSGGGALGFLAAEVRLLGHVGRFRCLGSLDFDALAGEDFARFTGSPSWTVDIETVTGAQLVERYGATAPDVVFMSPPCKGSSRLLSSAKAATAKYVAMNGELSALQGFPTEIDGQPIMWSGGRTGIAEHIGNSVPPPAARAIAERMLVALVEASVGAMSLSSGAVWVRPDARGALA
jgi:site-specific DNA-cytosine methylase